MTHLLPDISAELTSPNLALPPIFNQPRYDCPKNCTCSHEVSPTCTDVEPENKLKTFLEQETARFEKEIQGLKDAATANDDAVKACQKEKVAKEEALASAAAEVIKKTKDVKKIECDMMNTKLMVCMQAQNGTNANFCPLITIQNVRDRQTKLLTLLSGIQERQVYITMVKNTESKITERNSEILGLIKKAREMQDELRKEIEKIIKLVLE